MIILANDGISEAGKIALQNSGYDVVTQNIEQDKLIDYINQNNVIGLLVRSATKVRKNLIDQCPNLKLIGRGGVGMDNIDVKYAITKGIKVINTPGASSSSVAELVFAHIFGGIRFLYNANRNMPLEGDSHFKKLKKDYSAGSEIRGKTIGIIGLGRIGQEVARIGLSLGLNVIGYDKFVESIVVKVGPFNGEYINIKIDSNDFESVLANSDFISLHVPAQKKYVIAKREINKMKKGAALINAARGGAVNETDLIEALENGQLSFAALDTFENEPKPSIKTLMHPRISLSPHIGAATVEAQERIGLELAEQITSHLGK